MRTLLMVFLLAVSLIAQPAFSMTVSDYLNRKDENEIGYYVAGVGAGFYYAMNTAGVMGQQKLYCPVPGAGPTGEFYIKLLDGFLENEGSTIRPNTSVEVILLGALMKRFPC